MKAARLSLVQPDFMHSFCHATNFEFWLAVRLRLAKFMQLAFSFDTWVPLAPQHDFPPAKDELAANTPAANKAKVVLIMHLRQHELRNAQWAVIAIPVPQLRHRGLCCNHLKIFAPSSRVAEPTR